MVVVAQLVRALDCGSRGRRFEPGLPPLSLEKVPDLFLVRDFCFLEIFWLRSLQQCIRVELDFFPPFCKNPILYGLGFSNF